MIKSTLSYCRYVVYKDVMTWKRFPHFWLYANLTGIVGFATQRESNALTGNFLTHWGRVTHICDSKLSIIGSDNGLSPDRRQSIIWTNAGILLIRTLRTKFDEILIKIHTFSFKNIHLKMSSGKWRSFCHGLNVLIMKFRLCGVTVIEPAISDRLWSRFKATDSNPFMGEWSRRHYTGNICKYIFVTVKFDLNFAEDS